MSTPRAHNAQFSRKNHVMAQLVLEKLFQPQRVLVVGCGRGTDAAKLKSTLKCEVIGIDLDSVFDPAAAAEVQLQHADATALPFPDQSFDMVYSYHVLEHIPRYRDALREMRRVLKPGGGFCIGTPNRERLIGYIGATNQTWWRILRFNLHELGQRLRGRFRNEFGAHAGFSETELSGDLTEAFGACQSVSLPYYLRVYPKYQRIIRWMSRTGIGRWLFPSVYFVGRTSVS